MSGRRRKGLSPSLFPFLAVLVCTLGTLILLLALVAKNANDAAVAVKQQAEEAETDENVVPAISASAAESMIEEEEFRVTHLVSLRDSQTTELARRKDELTHLEDHIVRIREKLRRLSDEVEMATGTLDVEKIDEDQLASLRKQIDEESKSLNLLRQEKSDTSPRVVIVPHKGPNGTDRRPVYLECTAKGVTIWPEETFVSRSELRDSDKSANPLDAALRVIRYHALKVYGDTVAPYPLLIVRPSGIETYREARSAMADWDDQFGYELVPSNVKLAYAKPDSELKQKIYVAMREAILRQNARQSIAAVGRRNILGNARSGRRYPTLSAKALGRQGRASGFRSADPKQSLYTTSNDRSGQAANDAQDGFSSVRRLDEHLRTVMGEMKEGGSDFRPNSKSALNGAAEENQFVGPGRQNTLQPDSLDSKSSGKSNSSDAGSPDFGPYSPRRINQEKSARQTLGEGSITAKEHVSAILRGESKFETDSGSVAASDHAVSPATSRLADKNQQQSQDRSINGSQASSQSAPSRPGAMGSSSSGQTRPDEQLRPAPSIEVSNRDPQSLVKRQGAKWALPRSVANSHGNEIVRTLRVQCYRDRIVLLPSRLWPDKETFVVADGDVTRATLELATAVRERIERWGAAIPGGRWQPRLDIEVMPDGETRFHQIRTLMNGSGVDVQGRAAQ